MLAASLGFVAFAGSLASAASLSVTPRRLGAGTSVVASCDTNGVTTRFVTTYVPASRAHRVSRVVISGLSNTCHRKRLQLTLKRANGASLRQQIVASLNLPTGTTTANVTVGGTVLASNVDGIAIIITG
jgi:hypothetical protein